MTDGVVRPETNLLLASLPAQDQRRMMRHLKPVALRTSDVLYEAGQPVKYVHFPATGCLVSLVKVLDDGRRFDAGPVGYEGLAGVEALGGAEAYFGVTVRVGGQALRMRVDALKAELLGNTNWTGVLLRYLQFLLVNVSQIAGCNRFHPLEKHFCSWLLTLQDRIRADAFAITHEVFAQMLGVRRVGISQAAWKLQGAGLIRYSWGKLTILDRQGLEAQACVCYRQHTQAYQRLLDPSWPYR